MWRMHKVQIAIEQLSKDNPPPLHGKIARITIITGDGVEKDLSLSLIANLKDFGSFKNILFNRLRCKVWGANNLNALKGMHIE